MALSFEKVPFLIKNAIVNNAKKMVDAINPKNKKQALALLAAVMLTTTVGCGELSPETQETSSIINEDTAGE